MGTVLSIDAYKENKKTPQEDHADIDAVLGGGYQGFPVTPATEGAREVLYFDRLANELGPHLPFALQQVYNLLVFKKVPPVGPMVDFEVSTDPDAPTVIPVEWSGVLADVSGTFALLPALAGRTIRIELDGEEYYVCLSIKPVGGACEKA